MDGPVTTKRQVPLPLELVPNSTFKYSNVSTRDMLGAAFRLGSSAQVLRIALSGGALSAKGRLLQGAQGPVR